MENFIVNYSEAIEFNIYYETYVAWDIKNKTWCYITFPQIPPQSPSDWAYSVDY